jgi:uncharacterized protein (TIGR03435 family)
MLQSLLQTPLLDDTGLPEPLTLMLEFGSAAGLKAAPINGDSGKLGHRFLAQCQEQLGLKLVPGRGLVEVLVI